MKVVDMHCDTISGLADRGGMLLENSGQLDLKRMQQSGYLVQNFALFVDVGKCAPRAEQEPVTIQKSGIVQCNRKIFAEGDERRAGAWEKCKTPWERVQELYTVYCSELHKNRDWITPALCYEDILQNESAGKMSALLTVEEGAVCGGSLTRLRELYAMGVRMLTLTWNYRNELGWPAVCREPPRNEMDIDSGGCDKQEYDRQRNRLMKEGSPVQADGSVTVDKREGLTENGREFVIEMERIGMIPDVSHLSDAGFYDVLANTDKPFVASHSNARSLCPTLRNLTDDMIRKLAERGGCMGMNYYDKFLIDGESNSPGQLLEAAVRHARHITDVGGMEVLGLGSDFDGIPVNIALPGVEAMPVLWDALKKAGFTENELDSIFFKNVLRVYREVL